MSIDRIAQNRIRQACVDGEFDQVHKFVRFLAKKVCPENAPRLLFDDGFLLPETWKKVEDKAILSTDTVNQASNTFTETSLNLNGVSDGFAAYDRVTGLLLRYYDGDLY